jgi:hypothetical protein
VRPLRIGHYALVVAGRFYRRRWFAKREVDDGRLGSATEPCTIRGFVVNRWFFLRRSMHMQSRGHRKGLVAAAVMTAAMTTAAVGPSTATAADPCVSGAEVRARVHELVASLRDDIPARSTRAHIAAALVESLRTFRGFKADSAAERQELGQAIAALAKELKSAPSLVARKAIVAEILALTEQRERGPFTAAERAELKTAVAALKNAVIARTDRAVEGREVAAAFSALHEQFACRPA